jgi:hypothetical protein
LVPLNRQRIAWQAGVPRAHVLQVALCFLHFVANASLFMRGLGTVRVDLGVAQPEHLPKALA